MELVDWDDEDILTRWCADQRLVAEQYLSQQAVRFGALGDWPAWHMAPYAALWAVESVASPGKVGWWVISGDLPTNYTTGAGAGEPRAAVAAFARQWSELAATMMRGEVHPDLTIGTGSDSAELGPLLAARAETLGDLVRDASAWPE